MESIKAPFFLPFFQASSRSPRHFFPSYFSRENWSTILRAGTACSRGWYCSSRVEGAMLKRSNDAGWRGTLQCWRGASIFLLSASTDIITDIMPGRSMASISAIFEEDGPVYRRAYERLTRQLHCLPRKRRRTQQDRRNPLLNIHTVPQWVLILPPYDPS